MARVLFPDLKEAELRLLRAAPKGEFAICGPNDDDKDAANDPATADNEPESGGWGQERSIRADLIRWLCVTQEPSKKIDPRGVCVYGARITGTLDLSFATVAFPLRLARCRVGAAANFEATLVAHQCALDTSANQSDLTHGRKTGGKEDRSTDLGLIKVQPARRTAVEVQSRYAEVFTRTQAGRL